ncbi:MAG: peptide ABC transporter substrate-binding protein [Candidatus Eremiobacteraeota bacterium]|nr:peptide ABC transporter substrate-binding protein [Candidatus Eremiobacteraeota bacterium]MBV8365878.1 peptide ABC transporter substrate-binding protein [Candidatus Eremiobacteraeota bacterium]
MKRNLLVRVSAQSCIALIILFAAAGCTKIQSQTGPLAGGRNAWTIPGTLRIASRQEPDNLNPMLGTEVIDKDVSMFWGGYLFNWSDQNQLVPEMAAAVPTTANGGISKDGLTVTYHLRKNVRWQDGAPFGADDVIFTWQQQLNPANPVVSRLGFDDIARIDKLDDHTIAVHLKRRFSPFVNMFFTMSNNPVTILPKHLLSGYRDLTRVPFNLKPVGTGPFKVVEFAHGSRIVLEANPLYWRGPPKLKRIEWEIVGNDNTILTLLQSHGIDFYYRATESLAPSLQNIEGTRIVTYPFTQFADIGINASHAPLDDVRVRQALAYAIDRQELIAKVSHGINVIGDTDQPAFFWAYDPNAPKYRYDPKRAGELLDAAGWRMGPDGVRMKDGKPLQLQMTGFTGSSTVSGAQAVIQQQWRAAGIDTQIKNWPSNELYATLANNGVEQSGKFDVAYEEWANGIDPDESILVACDMAPPNGWNIYHFCDQRLDAAESDALQTYDQGKRKADYAIVQEEMQKNLPFIIIWYLRRLDVINTDFTGYKPAHAVTPFWNTWEWAI